MAIDTKSNLDRITLIAADTTDTARYLSDQNTVHFGTNRRTEIAGIIGDVGQPFEKIYNDYLDSL